MDEWEIFAREAAATGVKAQEQGLARLEKSWDELYAEAKGKIQCARTMMEAMIEQSLLADMPE